MHDTAREAKTITISRYLTHGIPLINVYYCIVFAVAQLLCHCNAQLNPNIQYITPGVIVDLGDTIDLSCSIQYAGNFPIIWAKLNNDNPPLFISRGSSLTVPDNRYSIRHDDSSSTYTLQVSKIQDTDSGIYQCQVVTSATSRLTSDTFISVRIPPLISDNSTRSIKVTAGETISLSCHASGYPTPKISWRRENGESLPTGGVVSKGNTVTIYNATKDDRGIYYCIADNGVGKGARRSVGVEIEFAPQVFINKLRYRQALGYPLELHCSVEAVPFQDVFWLKDGYQVANELFYQISLSHGEDFTQTTLRIKKLGKQDLGTYVCKSINRLGSDQKSMTVELTNEPVCPPACPRGEYLSLSSHGTSIETISYIGILCVTILNVSMLHLCSGKKITRT
ncbi:Lachesin, partial [Fragariocoptes setiger]